MIRFFNTSFPARTVFLGLSEACLVTVAFTAAIIVRIGTTDAFVMLNYEQGFLKVVVITAVFVLAMYYFDLYESSILRNHREVLTRVIQVLGTVSILLAVLYYVYPPLQLGRGIFIIGFALVAAVLVCWRKLFMMVNGLPRFADRAMIIGTSALAEQLYFEFESRSELGLRVVALFPEETGGNDHCLGAVSFDKSEALTRCAEENRVNKIIVALSDRRGKLPLEELLSLKSHGVLIQDGAQVYEAVTGKIPLESIRLGWLVFSEGFHVSRSLIVYGRVLSCLAAAVGILLSLPLLPLIALAIKLTSPGPVLYWQKRVGKDGKLFDCCKFRSMREDAEANTGPTWATDNDPRVTKVGRLLRTLRLDEIPQLWLVLTGKMNIIGPRPERPEFVARLDQRIPLFHLRHTIRPGLTGWAQIKYKYGSSEDDAREKLKYDLFYIKNMSPGLDFLILFHSIKIVLLGRGAK